MAYLDISPPRPISRVSVHSVTQCNSVDRVGTSVQSYHSFRCLSIQRMKADGVSDPNQYSKAHLERILASRAHRVSFKNDCIIPSPYK